MPNQGPEPCHYDRTLGERVTRAHRTDCPNPSTHRGCAPCTAPHCVVCGREHLDNAHPVTCPTCIPAVQGDLDEIAAADQLLADQAVDGEGLAFASAPIPGHTATILRGPTVRLDQLRVGRGYGLEQIAEVHHPKDPIPPLAVLAEWEDMWRAWFGHPRGQKASIRSTVTYLRDQVPAMAQHTGAGPDWLKFAAQVRALRSRLEHALHDEREPEQGVECFECGDQLVRRFRIPKPCRHATPARLEFERWMRLGYPEALDTIAVRATRIPCGDCSQGGLDDPSAGQSWECQGCRKAYDSEAYATAVRRDLLGSDAGDGWTHISMAAEAATTLTGHLVPASTVRKWMDRGKVAALCVWQPGVSWGLRMVFWPDVADASVEAVRRLHEQEQARKVRARQYAEWFAAVEAGEDPRAAGERMGLHPQRVKYFIDERERITA